MKLVSFFKKGATLAMTVSLVGCAEVKINELRNTVPQGSEFSKALAGEYLKFAESEYRINIDDLSTWRFSKKGLEAAKGHEVGPEDPMKYDLPEGPKSEILHSRNRLLHVLNSGSKTLYPVESAKAQVMYDCWIEQQSENFQHDHIAACRDGFFKYVRLVELRLDEKNPKFDPKLEARPIHKIYFKLGSALINQEGLDVTLNVADLYKRFKEKEPNVRVFVYAYADKIGTLKANNRLTERRASNVREALVKAGVDHKAIDVEGKGPVEGALKDPENRRVDIQIDAK